jgi:hypothetical protein
LVVLDCLIGFHLLGLMRGGSTCVKLTVCITVWVDPHFCMDFIPTISNI